MHSQRPALLHRSPGLQRVPVPVQRSPEHAFAMGCPQSTALAGGHIGMHSHRPATQRLPEGQRVPVPHEGPPGHTLGTGAPQSTPAAAEAAGHRGAHSHIRDSGLHCSPSAQPVMQRPPHPSSLPQAASAAQRGVHEHVPVVASQLWRGSGHGPMQRPPHPSSLPQAASGGQLGVHTHRPNTQRSFAPRLQGVAQPQVFTHVPLEHTSPSAHRTPAQGLVTHMPRTHTWFDAQLTSSQGDGGTQST